MELVFNELCLESQAGNFHAAREWMQGLIQTLVAACQAGMPRALRTSVPLDPHELAVGYPIARWRNDPDVDIEARRYYRTLVTKYPVFADVPAIADAVTLHEFAIDGKRCEGFGAAVLLKGLAVSIESDPKWNADSVAITHTWIEDEDGLEVDESIVPHIARPQHLGSHAEWIRQSRRAQARDGEDLLRQASNLLPNLAFCENACRQIGALGPSEAVFRQLVFKLFDLDAYCDTWVAGPFEPGTVGVQISPESQATLQQYSAERTFVCPDGQSRLFSLKVRLTPGAWRLYVFPQAHGQPLLIGYVGPHLRTVKFAN